MSWVNESVITKKEATVWSLGALLLGLAAGHYLPKLYELNKGKINPYISRITEKLNLPYANKDEVDKKIEDLTKKIQTYLGESNVSE